MWRKARCARNKVPARNCNAWRQLPCLPLFKLIIPQWVHKSGLIRTLRISPDQKQNPLDGCDLVKCDARYDLPKTRLDTSVQPEIVRIHEWIAANENNKVLSFFSAILFSTVEKNEESDALVGQSKNQELPCFRGTSAAREQLPPSCEHWAADQSRGARIFWASDSCFLDFLDTDKWYLRHTCHGESTQWGFYSFPARRDSQVDFSCNCAHS